MEQFFCDLWFFWAPRKSATSMVKLSFSRAFRWAISRVELIFTWENVSEWVVGSYVIFQHPVSCAQFHCSSTFLHGIPQIPARFIKTVMFNCQNDSFMLFSWMWRIALDKHYNSILCCHAGMTKFTLGCSTTKLLEQFIVNLSSTPKITRNIQGNPNPRLG